MFSLSIQSSVLRKFLLSHNHWLTLTLLLSLSINHISSIRHTEPSLSFTHTPTYFKNHGSLATSITYAHLTFNFNISLLTETIKVYCIHQFAVTSDHHIWEHPINYKERYIAQPLTPPSFLPLIQRMQKHNCRRLVDDYNNLLSTWYPLAIQNSEYYLQNIRLDAQLWEDHWNRRRHDVMNAQVTEHERLTSYNNTTPFYLLDSLTDHPTLLHNIHNSTFTHHRDKRFLDFILGATIGTIFSTLFTSSQISKLQTQQQHLIKALAYEDSRLNILEKSVDLLTTSLRNINSALDSLTSEQILFQAIYAQDIAEKDIRLFMDSLSSIAQHQLSPNLIPTNKLSQAITALKQQLQPHDLHLMSDNPIDIYRSEITHVAYTNHTIQIIAHLPAYKPASVLRFYEFVPIPTLLSNSSHPSSRRVYSSPTPQDELLAISTSGLLFRSFPKSYLATCNHISDVWYCPDLNFVDKRSQDSCLVALYSYNTPKIRSLCPFTINPDSDYLTQLNTTEYLLYQSDEAIIETSCPDSTDSFRFSGLRHLYLPSGCQVTTRAFIIVAEEDAWADPIIINGPNISFIDVMGGELIHHFHAIDDKVFDDLRALSHVRGALISGFHKEINEAVSNKNYFWSSIGTSGGIGLIILLIIAFLFYKYCCSNRNSQPPPYIIQPPHLAPATYNNPIFPSAPLFSTLFHNQNQPPKCPPNPV